MFVMCRSPCIPSVLFSVKTDDLGKNAPDGRSVKSVFLYNPVHLADAACGVNGGKTDTDDLLRC